MMTGAGGSNRRRVLHVVEGSGTFTDELSATLSSAGVELTIVPDVYLGLARIVRSPRVRFDAAVVSLNSLEADELDFISHLQRRKDPIPVFVYGHSENAARVVEAERRGARLVHDVSAIQSALALDVERPVTPETTRAVAAPIQSVEAAPVLDEERRDAGVSSMPDSAAPAVREPAKPQRETVDRPEPAVLEAEERVPVPWAPSSQRPVRQGPATPNNTDAPTPNEPDGRPLLTNEELSALLGPERTRAREATDEDSRESERAS